MEVDEKLTLDLYLDGALSDKVGTTKSHISKIENSVKEARLSTLEKIVKLGFGGKLELKITLH